MSTNPAGWLPLIITSLTAGGAVGAVITTYGGKSRERRQARSEVIACLQRIEVARLSRPTKEGLLYVAADFAELETKCMIAGVPRELVFLYRTISERSAGLTPSKSPRGQPTDEKRALAEFLAAFAFISRAAELLTEALWHPLLSRPLRHRRMEALKEMINEVSGRPPEMLSAGTAYRNWRVVTGNDGSLTKE
jgi:hypothetical protein